MMGGCEIDLSQASMRGEAAVFDIFAMMGGIEIRVPEDWAVENQGLALLGGFEDKTRRPLDAKKRLVLRGFALMGGVEVKN
jgi:predicted membrane protein